MTPTAAPPSQEANNLAAVKAELRSQMLAQRRELRQLESQSAEGLALQVAKVVKGGEGFVIAGYVAIGDELDPSASLRALEDSGASIVLPVAGGASEVLAFKAWRTGDALEKGRMSTYQPNAKADVLEPDVLLVPLVAFDRYGYRLGFGGGYYDRTLPELRGKKNIVAYGIGFDGQEVDEIPRDALDARLDGIITPSRFVPAQNKASGPK